MLFDYDRLVFVFYSLLSFMSFECELSTQGKIITAISINGQPGNVKLEHKLLALAEKGINTTL